MNDKQLEVLVVDDQIGDSIQIRILHSTADPEVLARGTEHGATLCIAKGVVPEEFQEAIGPSGYEKIMSE